MGGAGCVSHSLSLSAKGARCAAVSQRRGRATSGPPHGGPKACALNHPLLNLLHPRGAGCLPLSLFLARARKAKGTAARTPHTSVPWRGAANAWAASRRRAVLSTTTPSPQPSLHPSSLITLAHAAWFHRMRRTLSSKPLRFRRRYSASSASSWIFCSGGLNWASWSWRASSTICSAVICKMEGKEGRRGG